MRGYTGEGRRLKRSGTRKTSERRIILPIRRTVFRRWTSLRRRTIRWLMTMTRSICNNRDRTNPINRWEVLIRTT